MRLDSASVAPFRNGVMSTRAGVTARRDGMAMDTSVQVVASAITPAYAT